MEAAEVESTVPALAAATSSRMEIGEVVIVRRLSTSCWWADRIGHRAAARNGRHPAVVYFCSAAILSAGLYWLMVRTVLP